jgi:RimJ/RimL family protein N-acetyltransferase
MTPIRGERITLRPAEESDRRIVYDWMANSDITPSMMGPPLFPEIPITTWDDFINDYVNYFFDGTRPDLGRSYILESDGKPVGHISYSNTDLTRQQTELDIWLSGESMCGHGYGSDALRLLTEHLNRTLGIVDFYLRPSRRNPAVCAYLRAGFVEVPTEPSLGPNESDDTVTLRVRLEGAVRSESLTDAG